MKVHFSDGYIQYDTKTRCLFAVGHTAQGVFRTIRRQPLSKRAITKLLKELKNAYN